MKLKAPNNPKTALAYCNAISEKLKYKKLEKYTSLKKYVDDDLNTIKERGTETPLTDRQLRRISNHVKEAERLRIFDETELQRLDARYRKALSRHWQPIERSKNPGKRKEEKNKLLKILESANKLFSRKTVSKSKLSLIYEELSGIGSKHNETKYPKLSSKKYTPSQKPFPTTLAEAYIWKMGDWKKFKRFENMYKKGTNKDSRAIVHFAFAKHLLNNDAPIFDQHTLRSILVVYQNLSSKERKAIENYLVRPNGKWKPSGSSNDAELCYSTYCRVFNSISSKSDASEYEIDIYLMTLGRAIKKIFPCYRELKYFLNEMQ